MLTYVSRAVAVSMLAVPALVAAQAPTSRSIAVAGSAEVRVIPSTVNIVFGVETRDKALAAAKSDNDRRVQAVVQSIRALGVDAKDIQTDYVQVEPRYDELGGGVELRYYIVRKAIAVTVRDVTKFEQGLSGALQAGATHVMGVQFLTNELRKHRDDARARAIQAAREKAVALASGLNTRVGRVISIQEFGGGGPWHPYNNGWWGSRFGGAGMNQVSVQSGGNAGEPSGEAISLGQIGITASVNVTFELEPL